MAAPLIPIAIGLGAAAAASGIVKLIRGAGRGRTRSTRQSPRTRHNQATRKKSWSCDCAFDSHGRRNLYVIRLQQAVSEDPKFQAANPTYRRGEQCMYVGQTAHEPMCRREQHRRGYKASRIARKHGENLMPEMFEHLNPVPGTEAEDSEKRLANELRERGYGVWSN